MTDYIKRGEFSNFFWKRLNSEPIASIIKYASDASNGLDVQLRGNYINIYYKGGNILRINPKSFFFDKFYFYTDCKKDDRSTRKSIILDASKGDNECTKLISQDKAKKIIESLDLQSQTLLELLNDFPDKYFKTAKQIIDKWLDVQLSALGINHNEKASQHQISLQNKDFESSDLIVVDLEYAISQKASFAEENGNPRPDIVAIDKLGRVHVLELKYKFQATDGDAGVESHINDFENTIGMDKNADFVTEMQNLVESKKKLGLIDDKCIVNKELKPVFDLVFRGSEEDIEQFETLYGHFKLEGRVNNIIYIKDNADLKLHLR